MSMSNGIEIPRPVVKKIQARPQHEGLGAIVRRSIGRLELKYFDPFLLLDEFSAPAGFPDHPHRGFETLTYMLQGILVRKIEPTSPAYNVLKEGDVIASFDGVHVGCEGTVPFRSTERIAFRYLISQKFAGDMVELGIIREGTHMQVQTVLNPRVHLVPYHSEGGQPSYLIIAGLVFTPLSEPLIDIWSISNFRGFCDFGADDM